MPGIQNFPVPLQSIIQQNILEREFQDPIVAKLGFRAIADRETIPNRVGETVTKTRRGLLQVDTNPLKSTQNTNFDNGMTPQQWGVEQYTLTMAPYGITLDLNTTTDRVGIASQFVANASALGENAMRTLDTLARDALFAVYMGGNTWVTTTLGAPATTVAVDDVRGFLATWNSKGQPTAVTAQDPILVNFNNGGTITQYTCTGVATDTTNTSITPNGMSGVLTFSGNVSTQNGTQYNAVVRKDAPVVLRPQASNVMRATTKALVAGDTLQMTNQILMATSTMRDNNVPTIDGYYHWYGDNMTLMGLFKDQDFKDLYKTQYGATEYKQGTVFDIMGVKFIPTNMAIQQTIGGLRIRRSIICGAGTLVEGDFEGQDAQDVSDDYLKSTVEAITMITRPPMDRLAEIIAQSWKWIGGFTVPSDTVSNSSVIPTANDSAFKRAIMLESL